MRLLRHVGVVAAAIALLASSKSSAEGLLSVGAGAAGRVHRTIPTFWGSPPQDWLLAGPGLELAYDLKLGAHHAVGARLRAMGLLPFIHEVQAGFGYRLLLREPGQWM